MLVESPLVPTDGNLIRKHVGRQRRGVKGLFQIDELIHILLETNAVSLIRLGQIVVGSVVLFF